MPNRYGIELTIDDLPMWQWARLATPEFFNRIPEIPLENLPPELRPVVAATEESKVAAEEPKKEKSMFYFVEIKTQYCVDDDLSFSENLSKVYSRISKNEKEKVFLRGNLFLAKIAKAIFEQDSNLFVEACDKYADENYFKSCAKTLRQWNFSIDKNEKFSKESWASLYKVLLLLTEEYFATKCELPKIKVIECDGNSESIKELEIIVAKQDSIEKDLDETTLARLKGSDFDDSSDNMEVGEQFYKFLGGNFPKDKQADFKSMPKPSFKICTMEPNRLGAYSNKTISLNQRMVLDSLSENQEVRFFLLLTMLLEYGSFFNEVMCEKKKQAVGNSDGCEGISFMKEFMEYSGDKLFKESFCFADFTAPVLKDEKKTFELSISDLSYEQRKIIFDAVYSSMNG